MAVQLFITSFSPRQREVVTAWVAESVEADDGAGAKRECTCMHKRERRA